MKPARFAPTFALLLAAAAMPAAAQTPAAPPSPQPSHKYGVVNPVRIMGEARAALQAQKELEAEFKKRDQAIPAGAADTEKRKAALVEEMTQRRDDAQKKIVERANAVIKRIAEAENLDAVFFEAAYASPRVDLTERVIKALDATR